MPSMDEINRQKLALLIGSIIKDRPEPFPLFWEKVNNYLKTRWGEEMIDQSNYDLYEIIHGYLLDEDGN